MEMMKDKRMMIKKSANAAKVNPADPALPEPLGSDVARMLTGRPIKEMEAIQRAERTLREQQMSAFEQERRAVNEVAERERQMLAHIATMQSQLQESNDEIER